MGCCESTERSRNHKTGNETEVIDTERVSAEIVTVAIVAVAGVALLACGAYALFSSSSSSFSERKTMKAPGRYYRIFRDDFEDDPASYFRNLRK